MKYFGAMLTGILICVWVNLLVTADNDDIMLGFGMGSILVLLIAGSVMMWVRGQR